MLSLSLFPYLFKAKVILHVYMAVLTAATQGVPLCNPCPGRFFAWLVVLGFNATIRAKVISWRSLTHMCILAFSNQHNFFPVTPTTFLTCFCIGERRTYTEKKARLNRVLNSQPRGHESDTLTSERGGRFFGQNGHKLHSEYI